MNWFQQLCRNTGLMFHHIGHPEGTKRHVLNKTVEEKRIDQTTIVRRTTIEEVEIKQNDRDHDPRPR